MSRRTTCLTAWVLMVSIIVATGGTAGAGGGKPVAARWPACERWVQVDTPLVGEQTELLDVVVISPTEAWAVGTARLAHRSIALALRWDGWRWSRAATPALAGSSTLKAVAADDAGTVWAVGNRWDADHSRALIERWDGSSWRVVRWPRPPSNVELTGVATVPGSRQAWAVGVVAPRFGDEHGLAMRWSGATWRRTAVPEAAGRLWDVAMHGRVPWAVGASPGNDHAVSIRWGVSGWRMVTTPRAGGFLVAVAAQAGGDLWAVNYDAIYRRADGRWRTVRPLPAGTSALDVTFPSAADGWLVGGKPTGGEWEAPFAMRRHGSAWTRFPVPAAELASTLAGIDGTPHDVWAVGYSAAYSDPGVSFHYC
jgi:hypothetical protein